MRVESSYCIAREGFPFIATGVLCALLGAVLHWAPLLWVGAGWAGCCVFFFRNPARAIPAATGLVVSPADGTVIYIGEALEPDFLHAPMRKISIFLSVLNVHVNRIPCEGRVAGIRYTPGRFHIASRPAASSENERNAIWLKGPRDADLVMAQVAGTVARRIVSYAREGDTVARGERCGIIRFGSRCDLYLPLTWKVAVAVGDRVRGGSTVVGEVS